MFMKVISIVGLSISLIAGVYFALDNKATPLPAEAPIHYDWECKYIVRDGYNQGIHVHHINDYLINVNGSISFVGDDGLICNIPYPYFEVIKNEK